MAVTMTVEQLTNELAQNPYTPKTEEQMQAEAQRRFTAQYNQGRLSAQQSYDTTDLALRNQLNGLGMDYDRQRRNTRENVADSVSSFDRYSLQRGMQRSSYNAASIANMYNKGNQALADIDQAETDARAGIEAQRTLLAQQLAQQLAQYDTDYLTDVEAYLDELRDKEYERSMQAAQYQNQLKMALYEYQTQEDQLNNKSSGGSSRSSSSNSYNPAPVDTPQNNSDGYDNFMNDMDAAPKSTSDKIKDALGTALTTLASMTANNKPVSGVYTNPKPTTSAADAIAAAKKKTTGSAGAGKNAKTMTTLT